MRGGKVLREISTFIPMVIPRKGYNEYAVTYRMLGGKRVPIVGESNEMMATADKWNNYLSQKCPQKPLRGPVAAEAVYLVPLTRGGHDGALAVNTAPLGAITDMMLKTMARQGWFEDGEHQVVRIDARKIHSETPGIYINMWEVFEFDE